MGAKSNLLEYIELKGIKKPDFYKKTGLSNGFLDKNENISSQNIEIIISNYPDLSIEWLITGKGEMCRQTDDKSVETNDKISRLITILEETLKEKDKQIEKLMSIIEQGK